MAYLTLIGHIYERKEVNAGLLIEPQLVSEDQKQSKDRVRSAIISLNKYQTRWNSANRLSPRFYVHCYKQYFATLKKTKNPAYLVVSKTTRTLSVVEFQLCVYMFGEKLVKSLNS